MSDEKTEEPSQKKLDDARKKGQVWKSKDLTGVFVFQFFSNSLSGGAKAIIGNMGLVRSLHFPRAVLPISLVVPFPSSDTTDV